MAVTYEEIISDLRKRLFRPVYFLAGDEPYYIDFITEYIGEKVLTEPEKAFNQLILYGEDTSVNAIIETARRFPMVASHQVIIVKEAQSLKKIEDLLIYVEKPLASTILVLNYKYNVLDKRTKLCKALEAHGIYFESVRLRDYQVPPWIERHLMSKGVKIDPSSSAMLTEYLGTDLNKIVNELDKLLITMPAGKGVITPALIEKNIGISKDYNNFELQKAIGEKNILRANMIVKYFIDNPNGNPMIRTISSLFTLFSKILIYHYTPDKSKNNIAAVLKVNPFFVKDYEAAASRYSVAKTLKVISLLRTFDMKSKGYGNITTDPGDLLKELVYRILHL
jgi:DNA polymerase III subunit delta